MRALIMIPKYGSGAVKQDGSPKGPFYWVADALKRDIYKGKAVVARAWPVLPGEFDGHDYDGNYNRKTETFHDYEVKFETLSGKAFRLSSTTHYQTFVVISHGGPQDGPVFVSRYSRTGYQPWGKLPSEVAGRMLPSGRHNDPYRGRAHDLFTGAATKFWRKVAHAMHPKGKIIMLGCNAGAETYIDKVAVTTGLVTYGAKSGVASGDVKTAVDLVRRIEDGSVKTYGEAEPGEILRRTNPFSGSMRIYEGSLRSG